MGGSLVAILNPHFDLPFRFSGKSVAVVEQDSYEDIANCVESILRTPQGYRDDEPDFGNPLDAFETIPVNTDIIADAIAVQEPRATVLLNEYPDALDSLVDNIRVEIL
jgi:phage baseplate assembly protein W